MDAPKRLGIDVSGNEISIVETDIKRHSIEILGVVEVLKLDVYDFSPTQISALFEYLQMQCASPAPDMGDIKAYILARQCEVDEAITSAIKTGTVQGEIAGQVHQIMPRFAGFETVNGLRVVVNFYGPYYELHLPQIDGSDGRFTDTNLIIDADAAHAQAVFEFATTTARTCADAYELHAKVGEYILELCNS